MTNDARDRQPDGRFPATGRSKVPNGPGQPFQRANTAAVSHGARSRNPDSPSGWGPLARCAFNTWTNNRFGTAEPACIASDNA